MTFVHYQDCISPHQMPLAREIAKRFGVERFRYVYRDADQAGRSGMGWNLRAREDWCVHIGTQPDAARELLENAEVMLTGMRDVDLFERRAAKGLVTFYQTERWFKPASVGAGGRWRVDGRVRLLVPSFRRMARRFVELVKQSDSMKVLPIGVHAMRDMEWLGVPKEKMMLWGYFVAPSEKDGVHGERVEQGEMRHLVGEENSDNLKLLWVGRFLKWKRVDVIVEAVNLVGCHLDVFGVGPDEAMLKKLALGNSKIKFHGPIPIDRVRDEMRKHDCYVLSSDENEGWGAAVNEALEEGMIVLGTKEAGSSGTILPSERQFKSGDVKALAGLLERVARGEFVPQGIGDWSAARAAERLLSLLGNRVSRYNVAH